MAATTTNTALVNTVRRLVVRSEIVDDGVGATDLILVDKSTFTGPNGLEPGRLLIERIEYMCSGIQVFLEWDHTADTPIVTCDGQGSYDFISEGSGNDKYQGFVEPTNGDLTGDIVATMFGSTAGDRATITLYLRKKD